METRALFDRRADVYAQARPRYPTMLYEWLAGCCDARRPVWDVGCGNGQAAADLLGAHVSLKVTYRRGNQEVFSKVYQADGTTQGGKMFWGGAFAMKNAVQQSTKLAVDSILRQLIADLNASAAHG